MSKQEIRMAIVVILSVLIGETVFRVADRALHRTAPAAVSAPGPAEAAVPEVEACGHDVEKFCSGRSRSAGLGACLFDHLSELEPGCREHYPILFPKFQACWNDIFAICAGVPPRDNRIPRCLRDNAARVSAACRASPYFEQR